MKTGTVHIGIRRTRLKVVGFGYAVIALCLFLGCYFLAKNIEGGWSIAIKIIGGVIAILIAVTGASAMALLNKKEAGVILDQAGITDNSTQISAGLIEWKAVSGIETDETKKMILVFVKKPDVFIKNARNRAVKQLYERNMDLYKTPLIIESTYLDTGFDELKKSVLEYYKKFKK